jgi:hypothetical protein
MDRSRLGPALCAAVLPFACVREPLTGGCPDLAAGELVITEIRGEQAGSYRQWMELYNASDRELSLGGLRVRFVPFDGSAPTGFFLRDAELTLAPGAYAVLGGAGAAPVDYIDYDYTRDFHSASNPDSPTSLPGGGFFELTACDELIDQVRVDLLPNPGTWFLTGAPGADANDDVAAWCVDDFTVANTGVGVRGTPGEANPPCP